MGPALAHAPGLSRHRASLTPCCGGGRLWIAAVGRRRAALRVNFERLALTGISLETSLISSGCITTGCT
jgi:hypothetical protein